MLKSLEVLKSSFQLLIDEPKLFIPRIISTLISSIIFLGFLRHITSGSLIPTDLIPMMAVFYSLSLLGLFVWVMLASMVANREKDKILTRGLKSTAKKLPQIIIASAALYIASFIIAMPLGVGIFLGAQGSLTAALIGAIITLGLGLGLGFFSYFLPATILEKTSFLKAVKGSLNSSNQNKGLVTALTLISFVILGATFALTSPEKTYSIGYLAFISGRLVSAIVSTYFFVVSPKIYFD